MKRLIVSAPFGNYLKFSGATSTLGTFTAGRRGTLWDRIWKFLSTVRYNPKTRSWRNAIGLLNPGIEALPECVGDKIVSIRGFSASEWHSLALKCAERRYKCVELNLSCPNVECTGNLIKEASHGIELLLSAGVEVIGKLSPVDYLEAAAGLVKIGVIHFHLCNTVPSKRGGMSGKALMPHSLRAVREVRRTYKDSVEIIGGGGVTSLADVKEYISAGANRVAIGSMLFNPLNCWKVKHFAKYLEESNDRHRDGFQE